MQLPDAQLNGTTLHVTSDKLKTNDIGAVLLVLTDAMNCM
jgi:hypothetical protein